MALVLIVPLWNWNAIPAVEPSFWFSINRTFMELKRNNIYRSLYLEMTDYQLFAVNKVEKWIGYY